MRDAAPKPEPKKRWELTADAFDQLLKWFDEGHDSGGQRYLEIHRRLVSFFDRKNCLAPDDLVDETLNRVARRLKEEGAITSATPAQYFYMPQLTGRSGRLASINLRWNFAITTYGESPVCLEHLLGYRLGDESCFEITQIGELTARGCIRVGPSSTSGGDSVPLCGQVKITGRVPRCRCTQA